MSRKAFQHHVKVVSMFQPPPKRERLSAELHNPGNNLDSVLASDQQTDYALLQLLEDIFNSVNWLIVHLMLHVASVRDGLCADLILGWRMVTMRTN